MNTTVPTLDQLDAPTRNGLDAVTSAISKGWLVEHTADDHHSTIHATGSISERGRIVPMGEWVNVPFSKIVLGITGAGNSWVNAAPSPGTSFYQLSYTLIGQTMWLNVTLRATALTIATGTNFVTVNMPPGFRVAGGATGIGREYYGHGLLVNTGGQIDAILSASAGSTSVQVIKTSLANFVTDPAFIVVGQIALEVEAV